MWVPGDKGRVAPGLARAVHDKDFSARNPRIAHESAGTVTGAEPDETAD
jgi:hypothetical protein